MVERQRNVLDVVQQVLGVQPLIVLAG